MNKTKIKNISKRILAFIAIPFFLSGCSKQSECEIPTRHVHKYVSSNGITVYLDDEQMKIGNFDWTEDYIEITEDDKEFYKEKGERFYGPDNWEYLYNVMKRNSQDYLEFHYHYTTTESYEDSDGDTHYETKHHSGWDTDPTHRGVDGDVRIYHHKFYGYRIINKNGKYFAEKSPLVDDFREIINDYPFIYKYQTNNYNPLSYNENCVEVVYHEYHFPEYRLKSLKPSDFTDFNGPNLDNKELNINVR